MKTFLLSFALLASLSMVYVPMTVFAHENYVLTKNEINTDLAVTNVNVWSSLTDRGNLNVALAVAVGSAVGIIFYFLFQMSAAGEAFDARLQKLEPFGHVILRVALAASLLASAHFSSFLGPEIPLNSIFLGTFIKFALYILGVMMLFGLWSEITGVLSLIILLLATWVYKDYMVTYFNYFGEFIALIFFGSRVFSLDKLIYGAKKLSAKWHDYEVALIRITYGVSIMYPAITYKLLHPAVIVDIVNMYHINKFHWLFPHDPLLISLGTGLAQVAVGICLIFGFETRLNSFVTFVLLMMSVLFFKEAVWPHYVLLALCLYLIINNGGKWSLDEYFKNHKIQLKSVFLKRLA